MADLGITIKSLRVDGGMTASDLMMQIQSDVLGVTVGTVSTILLLILVRPAMRETTSLGAAFAAGLAVGFWASEQGNLFIICDLQ